MTIKPGQSLGQYLIIEQIGKGGMATVYRASQPSLSRQVAIKVLPDFFAEDPAFHARFRQEAMAIAKLRHPNVLTVFDSGEADGVAYIVTELIDGGTLAGKLGKPLPIDYCVKVLGPVASALDYAHAQGMIHRDVKPSNILLTTDGTPILSDFGLARMTGTGNEDVTRLTITGTMLGTPEYMAPEQVKNSVVGPAADTYALAVMLFEMLTGSVPHRADTPINVIMARLNDPLPMPRDRNPDLSEAVQDILLKGLANEPADRYATAGEMIRALDTAGLPPAPSAAVTMAAVTPVPAVRSGAPVAPATRPRSMALPAAAGLLVLGAVAFFLWSHTSAPSQPASSGAPAQVTPMVSATKTENATATAASPTSAPAPTAAAARPQSAPMAVAARSEGSSQVASAGLPPHGKLLYSLTTNAEPITAAPQQHPEDTIVVKGAAVEFTAATEAGPFALLPVRGIGDFVAVFRFVAANRLPLLTFRFHVPGGPGGLVVRIPAYLRLTPPLAGTPAARPGPCCQTFDMYLAPLAPSASSIFTGPQPYAVPAAASEEQVVVVSVTGPLIVVTANGQEIARASNGSLGPGGMSVSVGALQRQTPATLRLNALEIYDPPQPGSKAATARSLTASELSSGGRLLYELGPNVSELARVPQQNAANTLTANGKSLEVKAGGDTAAVIPLPVNGVADFVASLRLVAVSKRPVLQLRFHRTATAAQVIQIPPYLHLSAPAAEARPIGVHPCCQDLDMFAAPQSPGQDALFDGPQARSVPAAPNEEQLIQISVRGPLIVVYADGEKIAEASVPSPGPGGINLQVMPHGRGEAPAVLRINALEIYEAGPAR